VISIFVSNLT